MLQLKVIHIVGYEYSIQLFRGKLIQFSIKSDEINLAEDIQKVLRCSDNLRNVPTNTHKEMVF